MCKVEDIRTKTYEDLLVKLKEHGKCAVIRPTGFGKTFMLTSLLNEKKYQNILYLYPIQVVKNTVVDRFFENMEGDDEDAFDEETLETLKALQEIDGVTLMTYSKLVRLKTADFKSMTYDLIICDELHRIGAPKTKLAISKLIANNKNAHLVGATATPNRSDAFDVVNTYFNDITTFEYNAHDAFKDGLLKKPYYCYCTYDLETDLKEAAFMAGEDVDDIKVTEVLNKNLIEISNIYNMENIIKTTCDKYLPDTNYMKFIIFFSTMKQMSDKLDDVKGWFKAAYPNHNIDTLIITSENAETTANINKLESLEKCDNHIDLVCCIDMLNMGYHVNNLSGILMYRGTSSDIIYIQQLGRALSSGASHSAIVFDVVDNLHRKGVFDLQVNESKELSESKRRNTTISCGWKVNDKGIIVDQDGDEAPLVLKDGNVYDNMGNMTNFVVAPTGEIIDDENYKPDSMKARCNRIEPEDIIATGNEATYRELIAKLVAEPMHQRCKMALELHFRKWCIANGLPYPITNDEMQRISELTKEDFLKEFEQNINNISPDYPLHDVEKLLSLAEADGVPPLRLFAKLKNVSIPQILNVLGVDNKSA